MPSWTCEPGRRERIDAFGKRLMSMERTGYEDVFSLRKQAACRQSPGLADAAPTLQSGQSCLNLNLGTSEWAFLTVQLTSTSTLTTMPCRTRRCPGRRLAHRAALPARRHVRSRPVLDQACART